MHCPSFSHPFSTLLPYDIEDLWHRIYLWCMEKGHAYVGITSKPVNVLSLKNFDYDRYGDLNWSNKQIKQIEIRLAGNTDIGRCTGVHVSFQKPKLSNCFTLPDAPPEKDFSGRVYVDIMNATQGYDIEDLWHRIYLWCMPPRWKHRYRALHRRACLVSEAEDFQLFHSA